MSKRAKDSGFHASDRWLQAAVRYLARFDRTGAQVERFLKSKGATPAEARRTVGRLVDLRYLNESAYTDRWIDAQLSRRPMGRGRLKAALLEQGIAESLADAAISRALNNIDDETLARRAITIRQQRGHRLSPLQAFRLLRQRGFEEETVDRIIRRRQEAEGPD